MVQIFDMESLKTIQLILGILCLVGGIILLQGRKAFEKLNNTMNKQLLSIESLRAFLDTEISTDKLREFLEQKISTDSLRDRLDSTILVDKALFRWIKLIGACSILLAAWLIFTFVAY